MPQSEAKDPGRELAASVLDAAASTATSIGTALGATGPVGAAIAAGAAIARVAASLVRSLGADPARKVLEELRRRIDAGEGTITAAELDADDAAVDAYVESLFAGERP